MKRFILIIILLIALGSGYWGYSKYHYPKVDFVTVSNEALNSFLNHKELDILCDKFQMKHSRSKTKSDDQYVAKLNTGLVLHIVYNSNKILFMVVHEALEEKKKVSVKLINGLREKIANMNELNIKIYDEKPNMTAIQIER